MREKCVQKWVHRCQTLVSIVLARGRGKRLGGGSSLLAFAVSLSLLFTNTECRCTHGHTYQRKRQTIFTYTQTQSQTQTYFLTHTHACLYACIQHHMGIFSRVMSRMRVMSHMNESCLLCMSHVSCQCVMSHTPKHVFFRHKEGRASALWRWRSWG